MFDRNLLRIPGMKGALAGLMAAALALAALTIGQAAFLSLALAALWQGEPVGSQALRLAGFLACFAGRNLVTFARDQLLDRYSVNRARALRDQLLEAAFLTRSQLGATQGTASAVTAATQGIDQVEGYIRILPPKLCGILGISAPLLVAEFAIDWVSGIILAITTPVIFYFMMLLGKGARQRAQQQYLAFKRLSNHFMDTLRGLPALQAFGATAREDKRVLAVSERLRTASVRTISLATLSSALLDLTATLGVAAVAMMLAFRLMDGSMGLACALLALMLAPEFYTPIRSFAADFHATLDAKSALADIQGILEDSKDKAVTQRELPPWGAESELRVQGVSFSYGDRRTLEDVTFSARGFERIGLVGRSGSGKSTLANLLAGFADPNQGSFAVNGEQLDTLGVSGWMDQLHYIPQHPHLFSGTVRQNIAFYTPQASDQAIRQAVAAVGLEGLVASLPQGLDTPIGEGGRALSGGQAQRIALARIMLDPRPILVFDEPTAHLDVETERDLKERMVPLMEGRLVIFATHRAHWLDDMDRVLVVSEGRVGPLTSGEAAS